MKSPCTFDAARRDLEQKSTSSGHRSAVRRKCRQAQSSTEKKSRFARSARTRRSPRSRHVELGRFGAGVRKYGFMGKMHLVQCRADSVKHAASPSRRDTSRRVIHVASDSDFSSPLPMSGAATPRTSVRSLQPACRLRFPVSALVRCPSPPLEAHVALGEIWTQDSRSHIAMSYEPSIAWKASLRAHRRRFARPFRVLKPRWSGKPLNAASDLITTPWCNSDNHGISRGS